MAKTKKVKAVEPAEEKKGIVFHNEDTAPIGQGIPPEGEPLCLSGTKVTDESKFHKKEIGGIEYNVETSDFWSKPIIDQKKIIDQFLSENQKFAEWYRSSVGYHEGKRGYKLFKIKEVVPSNNKDLFDVTFEPNESDVKIYHGNFFDVLSVKEELFDWMSSKQSYFVLSAEGNKVTLAPFVQQGYLPLVPGIEMALNITLTYDIISEQPVEGSAVKLPEGTKPEIIYHIPKPPVYGVTNTMEDAIDQQKEAGIPELKHYTDPMSNKSTDALIYIIAGRQTDKVRQRKVLRLLREKLQ